LVGRKDTPPLKSKRKRLWKKKPGTEIEKEKLSGTYHKQNSNIVGGNSFEKDRQQKRK